MAEPKDTLGDLIGAVSQKSGGEPGLPVRAKKSTPANVPHKLYLLGLIVLLLLGILVTVFATPQSISPADTGLSEALPVPPAWLYEGPEVQVEVPVVEQQEEPEEPETDFKTPSDYIPPEQRSKKPRRRPPLGVALSPELRAVEAATLAKLRALFDAVPDKEAFQELPEKIVRLHPEPKVTESALFHIWPELLGDELDVAVNALKTLPGVRYLETVRTHFPKAKDPFRSILLEILARCDEQSTAAFLVPSLLKKDGFEDMDVVLSLARLCSRSTDCMDAFVREAEKQRKPAFYTVMVHVLGASNSPTAAKHLNAVLDAADSELKKEIMLAYLRLNCGSLLMPQEIRRSLTAADPQTLKLAIQLASQFHDFASCGDLIEALKNENEEVRDMAHLVLKQVTGQRFPPTVEHWNEWWKAQGQESATQIELSLTRLESPDISERAEAITQLMRFGPMLRDESAARVLQLLNDSAPLVRINVCYFLSIARIPGSEEHLSNALKDPDIDVQQAARAALQSLTGRPQI